MRYVPGGVSLTARRLRKHRTELNWTQSRLMRESGVDCGVISQIERGTKQPSENVLRKLAVAMGLDVAYLRGNTGR